MRFSSLDKLTPSMYLARPIYADDGRVLLNAGIKLTSSYILKLHTLGIPGAYISHDILTEVNPPEAICQQTRENAISELRNVFQSIQLGKTFDMGKINQSVNDIIDDLSSNSQILVNLTDIRSFDGYTFSHSINVCVLSIILGKKFKLNELQLKELAIGAILHDVGKIGVSEQIIQKPGPLTSEEMDEVQQHSQYGWQVLRHHPEISLLSAHVAFQHHERPNGKGYPRGLDDKNTALYAKIVGVADAYDAMTSQRVYRAGMLPAEALRLINQLRDIQFNRQAADYLLESVAPFPVGSLVTLNNREVGLVVDVNQTEHTRPVVRLLYQANGKRFTDNREVDLAKNQNLTIVEASQ